jgi:hypothetical protein
MSGVELFVVSFGIVFVTAGALYVLWVVVRSLVARVARGTADRTVAEVRRHNPPSTVAEGANTWMCTNCRSVNLPDATACYRCRGDRATVEGLHGRI